MSAVHPWDEPDTETSGGPVRTFAVGRQGDEGDALREQCQNEVYGHRHAHAARIARWKDGDRTSPFPAGTLRGHTFLGMPLDVPAFGAVLGAPHPSREEVEAELAEKRARRAAMEEARRERMREREERRARARERAELDELERELEDEARRVRVIDFDLVKPERTPTSGGLLPKSVVRRGLEERRPTKRDGARVVVLRTRDTGDSGETPKRRRRGSSDPPE
jgi:hypothetical protein